jgi:hypothetical protein
MKYHRSRKYAIASSTLSNRFANPILHSLAPFSAPATMRSSSSRDTVFFAGTLDIFAFISNRQTWTWPQSFKDLRQRLLPGLASLHNLDLLLRQAVKLVDQSVDLPVRGLDATGEQRPLVLRAGGGEISVQMDKYKVRAFPQRKSSAKPFLV